MRPIATCRIETRFPSGQTNNSAESDKLSSLPFCANVQFSKALYQRRSVTEASMEPAIPQVSLSSAPAHLSRVAQEQQNRSLRSLNCLHCLSPEYKVCVQLLSCTDSFCGSGGASGATASVGGFSIGSAVTLQMHHNCLNCDLPSQIGHIVVQFEVKNHSRGC